MPRGVYDRTKAAPTTRKNRTKAAPTTRKNRTKAAPTTRKKSRSTNGTRESVNSVAIPTPDDESVRSARVTQEVVDYLRENFEIDLTVADLLALFLIIRKKR